MAYQEIQNNEGGLSVRNKLNSMFNELFDFKDFAQGKLALTKFDCTVGQNGDYATVKEALAAGRYKLKFISDVTETADISDIGSRAIYIEGDNYTWNLAYRIRIGSNTSYMNLIANNLIFNITSTTDIFDQYNIFTLNNCKIVNSEPSNAKVVFCSGYSTIDSNNLEIDQTNGGVGIVYLRNIEFLKIRGNGYNSDVLTTIGIIKVCEIEGTFGGWANVGLILNGTTINYINTNDNWIALYAGSKINGGIIKAICHSGVSIIRDTEITGLFFRTGSGGGAKLFNCKTTADIYGDFRFLRVLENCTVTTDVNIADYENKPVRYDSCSFEGNVTIRTDNVTLDKCEVANGTITVEATADKTTIISPRTLTPIVDNGTNTQIIAPNLI